MELTSVNAGSFYMVLCVRGCSGFFFFVPHSSYLSATILIVVSGYCSRCVYVCGQSTTRLTRRIDSGSSSRIREGSGSSQGELGCLCDELDVNLECSRRYSPKVEFSSPTFRKRGWCGLECSHLGTRNRHGASCRLHKLRITCIRQVL